MDREAEPSADPSREPEELRIVRVGVADPPIGLGCVGQQSASQSRPVYLTGPKSAPGSQLGFPQALYSRAAAVVSPPWSTSPHTLPTRSRTG